MHFVEVRNIPRETKNKPENVVEYLENHPEVDIVLSDIMLSGINGWKLLEKIKARFPLLTVIMDSRNRMHSSKSLIAYQHQIIF